MLDLPPWFFKKVDRILQSFFWAGSLETRCAQCAVAWKTVCTPKALGGLGVKNLRTLNQALRMRWRWLELTDDERPWHGLNFTIPQQAEHLFLAALDCRVGNGERLRFWFDPWIGGCTAQQIAPTLWQHIRASDKRISVWEALQNNRWIGGIRGELTVQAVVEYLELWELVQNQDLIEEEDGIRWRLTANGKYSAKSAYAATFVGRTSAPCAKEIWSAGAPLTQKIHMWLAALRNRIWTADRLARRGLQHPPRCPLCDQEPEDGEHLMVRCVFALEVWFAVLQQVGLQRYTPTPNTDTAQWWTTLVAATPKTQRKAINGLIILTARSIWLERNSRVFDHIASPRGAVCNRIRQEFALWRAAGISGEMRGRE